MNCKYVSLLLLLFISAAFGQDAQTSSVVGYQMIEIAPGAREMASSPFGQTTTQTVQSIIADRLDGGASAETADAVRLFDRASEVYRVYYPETVAGTTNWSVGANLETLLPGKGFWIENNVGASTNIVWVYGQVPSVSNITVVVRPGLQMIHYPYPDTIQLSATGLTALGHPGLVKSQSDLILQWNSAFGDYDTYWLFDDAGTRRWVLESADPSATPVYADLTLSPGRAFWYQRKKDLPAFNWTVTKPYVYP